MNNVGVKMLTVEDIRKAAEKLDNQTNKPPMCVLPVDAVLALCDENEALHNRIVSLEAAINAMGF